MCIKIRSHRVQHIYYTKFILIIQLIALLGGCSTKKISEVGKYNGYSSPSYDGYIRKSEYISVRDGTKIAIDIFRPTLKGKVAEELLPVIWTNDRYCRASIGHGGKIIAKLDRQSWLQEIVKHGYIIGVADIRGTGASYGTWKGPFAQSEAKDAYDIIEWFSSQPWCNGQIGMFGSSYLDFLWSS